MIYLAVDGGFAKVGVSGNTVSWPAPESLRKEEYVVLIVFRTEYRHVHQVRIRGKELVRRAAQLGNEEVRLKLLLHPERVQRVARCGQNVLHAVEHVRDRRVTHVSAKARVP